MNQVNLLRQTLKPHLGWHGARLRSFPYQPLKIKKHGRLAKSIFRYSLDYLRSIVIDLDLDQREFLHSLQFLSCT